MAKKQLDTTYFQGELTIGQLTEPSGAVATNLAWFIAKYEEVYNKLLLGTALYDAYVAGMAAPGPEARWVTLDNLLYRTSGVAKLSPSANYVYWFYQRDGATQTTGNGERLQTSENSKNVGSAVKVKLAWNWMVHEGNQIQQFIERNLADYPLYVKPIDELTGLPTWPESRARFKDRMSVIETVIPYF